MNYLKNENGNTPMGGSDSHSPDFRVNPFSSEHTYSSPLRQGYEGQAPLRQPFAQGYEGQAPQSSFDLAAGQAPLRQDYAGQARFPQFGDTPIYSAPQGGFATAGQAPQILRQAQGAGQTISENAAANDIPSSIEAAKSNGWGAQVAGFFAQSRKRIILILGIVLLLTAGSYLSNQNNQNAPALGTADLSQTLQAEGETGNAQPSIQPIEGPQTQSQSGPQDLLAVRLSAEGDVIIEDSRIGELRSQFGNEQGSSITQTAKPGDGITHLARRALKEHLTASSKSLSPEQKIYAEDYVQNRVGEESLAIGQKLSFSTDLLSEAVEQAEQLEQWEIENLTQYTQNVSLL